MNLDSERIKELFGQAIALADAGERIRFLAQACGDATELRQQVESLLSAHEQAGEFLGQTIKLPATTGATVQAAPGVVYIKPIPDNN
jgi:serine/threonine-protein kinase